MGCMKRKGFFFSCGLSLLRLPDSRQLAICCWECTFLQGSKCKDRTETGRGECTATQLHLVPWGHFWFWFCPVMDSQRDDWSFWWIQTILLKEITLHSILVQRLLVGWLANHLAIQGKILIHDLISMLISIWYNACETYGLTPDP